MEKPKLQEKYQLFIDGAWKDASDGATFDAKSPQDGSVLASCAQATKEDVDAAVKAAWAAFPTWKNSTHHERAAILNKIADIIEENAEFLAAVESTDNGKPIRETMAVDIPMAAKHFRYFAGVIFAEEGTATVMDDQTMSLVLKEPIGVVGQIVPWNFPFLMMAWKLAPVLAAGCCTVLKTSSETSLSVLEFTKLVQDVIPKGVYNLVTGSGSKAGEYILQHPDFSKLAFTGSTEVGRSVALAAAEKLIPATLELGGKSANIFFADCDMDMAIDGLQVGILFNQGQVCCAGSRVYVQESFYDEFVAKAVEAFKKVKVGPSLDSNTQMGCQINEGQVQKILGYIDVAKDEGATIAYGGERYTEGEAAKGCYMTPTLITNVTNDMRVAREEIFGPVAVVIPFKDEADVIAMANDSEYGLGGGVWTTDITTALNVSRAIETGRVWVNTYNTIPEGAPFGGYKTSGIGRETHKVILEHYTQQKNIIINLKDKPTGFYPQ